MLLGEITTDCCSEEGVTAGLIDAMISIARVVARRRFGHPAIKEALADIRTDPDVRIVLGLPCLSPSPGLAEEGVPSFTLNLTALDGADNG